MCAESVLEQMCNFASEKNLEMKQRRDRTAWVLEPSSRLTINQLIGGALYDFIDSYPPIKLTTGTSRSLLTCIRETTSMSDRTLKRIFLGKSDSTIALLRIRYAIKDCIPNEKYHQLNMLIESVVEEYGDKEGATFLEEQARLNRPKRKPP